MLVLFEVVRCLRRPRGLGKATEGRMMLEQSLALVMFARFQRLIMCDSACKNIQGVARLCVFMNLDDQQPTTDVTQRRGS